MFIYAYRPKRRAWAKSNPHSFPDSSSRVGINPYSVAPGNTVLVRTIR